MKKHVFLWLALALTACGQTGREGTDRMAQMAAESERELQGMQGMDGGEEAAMSMAPAPIRLTARQAALAGVTFAVAREGPLRRSVRAVAMVVPNERGLGIVNARVSGWVEKLYVNETGRHVEAGEPLFELYSPDLVTAQEELLLAKRLAGTADGESLLTATRRRLKLWDISDDQITELERSGEIRRTLTIRSAYRGHVLEKDVIEGQMVRPGDRLFHIADLSTVWIEPAIFEQDIRVVRVGQRAEVAFDALPGHTFEGRVTFIQPTLDARTRTLRLRVEVENHDLLIKPAMYGVVRIQSVGQRGVLVPLTAVLPTGERELAFVVRGSEVIPTPIAVGARGDSSIVVTNGIAVGDTIIASATFLFDSESSLAAAMKGIMLNMGMGLDMGGMSMEEMEMETDEDVEGGRRP